MYQIQQKEPKLKTVDLVNRLICLIYKLYNNLERNIKIYLPIFILFIWIAPPIFITEVIQSGQFLAAIWIIAPFFIVPISIVLIVILCTIEYVYIALKICCVINCCENNYDKEPKYQLLNGNVPNREIPYFIEETSVLED